MSAAEAIAYREICELGARYNAAWDTGTPEEWAATFIEDGRFEEAGRRYRGREQLRELKAGFPGDVVHFTSDHLVEVDGERANASCSLLLLDRGRGHRLAIFGRYRDRVVKTADGWLYESRLVEIEPIDWPYEDGIWRPGESK